MNCIINIIIISALAQLHWNRLLVTQFKYTFLNSWKRKIDTKLRNKVINPSIKHFRLKRSKIRVILGDHDQTITTESAAIMRAVTSIVRHRSFDPDSYNNDIALLKLRKPVNFSRIIKPVCLPGSSKYWSSSTPLSKFTDSLVNCYQYILFLNLKLPGFKSRSSIRVYCLQLSWTLC